MKLSKCLLLVALSLSATGHAQTSQTYHFGEGQSGLQGGNAASPPPLPGAEPTQPLPPGEPHAAAKPKSKAKSRHTHHHRRQTTHHRTHHTRHAPRRDPYSRP